MDKIIIFGNSGSGKTTLARNLVCKKSLAHLDLDTVAWKATLPPERMPLAESMVAINAFLNANDGWVIEGCYADLLDLVTAKATEMIFLNLSIETCIENAKNRPWEPHKYESKAAQDENLAMLIDWISQYNSRTDTFSKTAHAKLFDAFKGKKIMYRTSKYSAEK